MAKKTNQHAFNGRTTELAALDKILREKTNRHNIYYITGQGGMGKTYLLQKIMENGQIVDSPDSSQFLRVFICHSSNDKPAVRELYKRLSSYQLDIWLDEKKLLPGHDWNSSDLTVS